MDDRVRRGAPHPVLTRGQRGHDTVSEAERPDLADSSSKFRRRAKSKLDARWQEGVYLGLRLTSSEKIIGTPSGILVVQSIRRKPADKQFNLEMLKAVKGTPWQPNPEKSPNADADRLPEPIAIEPVVAPAEPPPQPGQAERLPTYRRMYIRQSDLERIGYTGGCEACATIREGRERRGINHNEVCRKRVQEALKETSQGQARLERETQRETEFFTKVHEAEEKKRKAATEGRRTGARRRNGKRAQPT